jgi:hypothetical protein
VAKTKKKTWSHKEFSRKGGLTRAKNLPPSERSRIAKLASDAAKLKKLEGTKS